MNPRRWVTVIVLVTLALASTLMLTSVHDELAGADAGFDLGALDDASVDALRDAVGTLPDPPCDVTVAPSNLPDAVRKACNRHYLAVVKAARALGHTGARIRNVRDPRFYDRFAAPG